MVGPGQKNTFSVHLETYGCQMNVYDSAAISGLLTDGGFELAQTAADADVVLLNTCSVREHGEHRVLSRVGALRSSRQARNGLPRVIGICGCMAERLGNELLAAGLGVDLVMGVDQYDQLADKLHRLLAAKAVNPVATGHRPDAHYVAPPEAYPQNNSHLVTIHKGCDYRCTYCIVPDTRGPQREKAPASILDEIQAILAGGGREVTLLGQNVTAYHWREELDFPGLLRWVAELPDLQRIRFLTGHPRDMTDELLQTMADEPKICPALHVPLQSGSNRILRRMKRLHTREEYLAMVTRARDLIPRVTFSSDFIVGFPGEDEADFRDTLEVLAAVQYDQVFSFKYSPRPGTPAARLADDVPLAEKKRRLAELMDTQADIWRRLSRSLVGQTWRGVVEGQARRPAGTWRVRTANNRKVLLAGPSLKIGQEVLVRVTGCEHTTFQAEILTEPDEPLAAR